jgi:hypothetical protein
MLVTGLIAAATAAKWITVAKIMIAAGSTMTTVYSLSEKLKENKKKG